MAVIDAYVSPFALGNTVSRPDKAINANTGAECYWLYNTFAKAAGDSDTSKWRLFRNLDANLIPVMIVLACDALAGFTSASLGLYKPDVGGAADAAACFMSAVSIAAGAASLNPKTAFDGMAAVGHNLYGRRLFEHAGHTIKTKRIAYDLVLTGNTVGGAAGNISVGVLLCQG